MILCLGPKGSGKTLLLKKLKQDEKIDATSSTVPTVGTHFTTVQLDNLKEVTIREIGGAMTPIWKSYFTGVKKIIYVVDASNLCQISAAGVLFYELIADPVLATAKILLVLTKMDVSYRQMRNEALLMMQLARLKREEFHRDISVIEASGMSGQGIEELRKWLET
ncbi:ADP-ribosylation factor-like protein 16 [Hetaerina americana]|uniref:ADP-ribosylation factor-like protein 16 n=1 Tax=Hetaerina americana TaxID=62018 RepID=UPI003A7F517C